MSEDQEVEEAKISEASFLFVELYFNGKVRETIPVQSTEEAERIAMDKRIWDNYGDRWFVAVPIRREIKVSYSLPSNGSNGSPKEAAVDKREGISPAGIFDVPSNDNGNAKKAAESDSGLTPERIATFLASI